MKGREGMKGECVKEKTRKGLRFKGREGKIRVCVCKNHKEKEKV